MCVCTRSFVLYLRTRSELILAWAVPNQFVPTVSLFGMEDVMSQKEEAEGHFSEERQSHAHTSMSISTDSGSDAIVYRSKNLSVRGFSVLNKMREGGQLCDVVIRVDEREFYGHRVVLAATVPYFMAMFTSETMVQRIGTLLSLTT